MSRHHWLLIAIMALPFVALGTPPLFDLDEGAFTASTREMFLRGDFLSSYLLGEPRHDKPILIYWLQAASVSLLGSSEFTWRLPSALTSSLWVLVTFAFLHRLRGTQSALAGALIIATAAGVVIIMRAATADALLNLWLACAGYASWLWLQERHPRWLYAAWLALALGFLTKGPVALVIPGAAVWLWCITRGDWKLAFAWTFTPGPLLLFLAVAVPWFALQTWHEGPGFLSGFFLKHNLSRFDAPMEGHDGNLLYYFPVVLLSLLPHTGLLLLAATRLQTIWRDDLLRFGLLWFLFAVVLFSFSGTKLPHYVYYGYAGLIPILASQLQHRAARGAIVISGAVTFALLLALPLLLEQALPGLKPDDRLLVGNIGEQFGTAYWLACSVGLIVSLASWRARKAPLQWLLVGHGVGAAGIIAVFLLPIVGHVQQAPIKQAGLIAREHSGPLVLYGINTPSFQTYASRQVLKRPPRSGDLVLTRESRLRELADSEVLFRQRSYVLARVR